MNRLLILAASGILATTVAYAETYDSTIDQNPATGYERTEGINPHSQSSTHMDLLQQTDKDEIVGMEVVDTQGDELGHVEKVVQDSYGRTHLVIEVDEWSIGDKKVVVATDLLQLDSANENLQVALSKESLKSLPAYDESRYFEFSEDEVEAE